MSCVDHRIFVADLHVQFFKVASVLFRAVQSLAVLAWLETLLHCVAMLSVHIYIYIYIYLYILV